MKKGDVVTLYSSGNVWEIARIEVSPAGIGWYWLEWIAGDRGDDPPHRQIRVAYPSLVPLTPLEALALAAI